MSSAHVPGTSTAAASNQAKARRIAVLGTTAVGKSSLVIQFCENHFVDSYYPTIENTFTKTIKYRGHEYAVEIMDTAGQDEYSILSSHHASSVHGYILVYSIASRSSFDMIKIIRDKILDFTGLEKVPCVIVGNKSDLNVQRQVTKEDGEELAATWACPHVEASAKHNDNVAKIFDSLIATIEKANNPPPEEKNACVIS